MSTAMTRILPISAIAPTRNRAAVFGRMLRSLAGQSAQPIEMIVVDASETFDTEEVCKAPIPGLETRILYHKAKVAGAIEQRNQALTYVTQDSILFVDDDILFEPDCVIRLWEALQADESFGGVNALITNQRYFPPGTISRTLFRLLHGRREETYAGKCIGPAFNLLPEERDDVPLAIAVEWLNTTCTLYRRKALPEPPFITERLGSNLHVPSFPMEDLALSLRVGKNWKLANAPRAKIFHDSQPGNHKSNVAQMSKMELLNRHYLMSRVLERRSFPDYLKLALFESFIIATSLTSARAWQSLPAVLAGKISALGTIMTASYSEQA
jgi:glycosyltransferase involved in cell wall biosynthesis